MKVGTAGFIGERLREAREARGLTAISLASIVGTSRAAISQYEQGVQSPRPEVMEKICKTLRMPDSFFVAAREKYDGAIYWRSLASTQKLARQAAEVRLDWFQDIVNYSKEFVEYPDTRIPSIDLPGDPLKLTDDDIEKIAMQVRKYWELGEDPIPNAVAVLENNGVFISRDDLFVPEIDGLSRWSPGESPCCLIASGKQSAVRSRMDIFHELGHLILHRYMDQRMILSPLIHKIIEKQAFVFAGAFAMPQESFAADVYSLSLDSFVGLKMRWKVAIGAMIMRCSQLGMTTEDKIEKLWIAKTARGWRTKEPLDDVIPIEQPELVSGAIKIMLQSERADRVVSALRLSASDVEDLAGLAPSTLEKRQDNLTVMVPSGVETRIKQRGKSADKVLQFGDARVGKDKGHPMTRRE
jgi:Zn-dependent peptidase ImmA (M78 family)/DNA-binding XRE family transcriptional regulator